MLLRVILKQNSSDLEEYLHQTGSALFASRQEGRVVVTLSMRKHFVSGHDFPLRVVVEIHSYIYENIKFRTI